MAASNTALDTFVVRARAVGHPVESVHPGRWTHPHEQLWVASAAAAPSVDTPPNDLLDLAAERARERVAWVHAVLPDMRAAERLGREVAGGLHRAQPCRGGDPRQTPFEQLVAEAPVGPFTVSALVDGHPVHAVNLPAAMLPALTFSAPHGSLANGAVAENARTPPCLILDVLSFRQWRSTPISPVLITVCAVCAVGWWLAGASWLAFVTATAVTAVTGHLVFLHRTRRRPWTNRGIVLRRTEPHTDEKVWDR